MSTSKLYSLSQSINNSYFPYVYYIHTAQENYTWSLYKQTT